MDADYDPNAASLNDRNYGLDGRSKRSKRKKNRLKKVLEKKKPLFNPGINGSKLHRQFTSKYGSRLYALSHQVVQLQTLGEHGKSKDPVQVTRLLYA